MTTANRQFKRDEFVGGLIQCATRVALSHASHAAQHSGVRTEYARTDVNPAFTMTPSLAISQRISILLNA